MRPIAPMSVSEGAAGAGGSGLPDARLTADIPQGRAVLGAGTVGVAIFLACCTLWLVLDPLKYAAIAAQRQGLSAADALLAGLTQLPAAAWLLVCCAGLAVAAAVVIELRARAISAAVSGDIRAASLLVLFSALLWFGHAYLYAGHLLGGDTGAHIARVAHLAAGLGEGELRYWDNGFYGGATFLQFTGPLFFWFTGAVAWLAGDAVVAVKLVLLALHFASGWAVYRLLRQWDLSRPAATLGSVIYAGAFAHLHLMLFKGALPQAITLALLPVLFLCADRLAAATRHAGPAWAAMSIAVAALIVAHQPHGLMSGLYLAAYVVANLAFRRYPAASLWRFGSAAVVAALLSSFAVVPWLIEGGQVMGGAPGAPVFWDWPGLDYFAKLLTWSNRWTSEGAASVAYVGLTSIALAAFGLIGARRGDPAPGRRLIVVMFAIFLLVSFGLRGDFVRDILFTLFFVAVLAGFGAERLLAWRHHPPRLALVVMLLVFADLGPTAVQPLARSDKAYLDAAGAYLVQSGRGRVVLMHDYTGADSTGALVAEIGPSSGPISYPPVQTLSGPHNMAATQLHNYAVAVLKRVEGDLRRDGALSPDTAQLLAMLNVERIVSDNGTEMGLPVAVAGLVEGGPLGRVLPVAGATPAVIAPSLATVAPPPGADHPTLWESSFGTAGGEQARTVEAVLDAVIAAMELAPGQARAAAIPVRPDQVPAQSASSTVDPFSGDEPALTVLDYEVEAQRVEMRLLLSATGYVQLAHPWHPHQVVMVDGEPAQPLRGTLNLLVLPMEAGEHVITVEPRRSVLRQAFGGGAALLLLAVIAVAVRPVGRAFR